MTRVYDALLQAEAERQRRTESPVSTDVLFATPAASPSAGTVLETDDLQRLRDIVVGTFADDFDRAVARLEQRLASEEDLLRTELAKLEQRLEDRLAEVDSRSCQDQAELRQKLWTCSTSLGDAIKRRSADTVQRLGFRLEELRGAKLSHDEFAAFLRGLARHLSGEAPSR